MLITCPECELQVSDKAFSCPHCGYPMNENIRQKKRSPRRMRLPNGFGQISEIKNKNLRKPFRAMVTVGKTETGRPICKLLKPESYFETYNDAYAALVEYNKNPYDLSPSITMKELYEKWSDKKFSGVSDSTIRRIKSSWNYCSSIYDMRVVEMRIRHFRGCIENAEYKNRKPSALTKENIKNLLDMLMDYAVEYEMTDRNYARDFKLPSEISSDAKKVQNEHVAFTEDEITTLWQNINAGCVDMMIVQCYSGWRPQELCELRLENINLEERYFRGGMKTDAGKNRVVPIHSRVYELVKSKYNEAVGVNSEFLFNNNGDPMTYGKYQRGFDAVISELGLNPAHRPHDCRKTFVTRAKEAGVNEYAIKRIVGHSISDLTENVYTERSLGWLASEIEKIK